MAGLKVPKLTRETTKIAVHDAVIAMSKELREHGRAAHVVAWFEAAHGDHLYFRSVHEDFESALNVAQNNHANPMIVFDIYPHDYDGWCIEPGNTYGTLIASVDSEEY